SFSWPKAAKRPNRSYQRCCYFECPASEGVGTIQEETMRKAIYRILATMAVVFLVASGLCAGGPITSFKVSSTIPADGAGGVAEDQVLTATFNQDVKCSTIQSPATTFTLTSGAGHHGVAVGGTVTCSGMVATFTPSSP